MRDDVLESYRSCIGQASPVLDYESYGQTEMPRYEKKHLERLISDVRERAPRLPTAIPDFIEGCVVVMLGCSTGRDAFIASSMVGQEGHVFAFDPCQGDIDQARSCLGEQMKAFGYPEPNIEFEVGVGESLALDSETVDVVIINALFNVSPDQKALLEEAFRVLKPGGELYMSTVFCDNIRLSQSARSQALLRENYLCNALYISDFRRMLASLGINGFRYMEKRRFKIKALRKLSVGALRDELSRAKFSYRAVRTFKLYDLEDSCENYRLFVTYLGTAPGCEQFFDLDDMHRHYTDEHLEVCGNTYLFIANTRFAKYFKCEGDRTYHYGIYDYCRYCGGGAGAKMKKASALQDGSAGTDCLTCPGGDCGECRA